MDISHFQVAPGWSIRTLVDISGVLPYRAMDYANGTSEVLDNAPIGVASLYPPFDAELAVAAGRSIIEVHTDGSVLVHDYRPAVPDTTGPDGIYRMTYGAPADTGPGLWLAAPSQAAGDGLYFVSPSWQLTRDNANNNVSGVAFDATGAFDARGVATLYFVDQSGLERRDSAASHTNVFFANGTIGDLGLTATAAFTVSAPTLGTSELDRIFETTHASQSIATATVLVVADGGLPTSTSAIAIRDNSTLVVYANDGTFVDGAASTDAAWVWVHASAPQPPHALAGSYVVLESNRALDRDRLLLVTPP